MAVQFSSSKKVRADQPESGHSTPSLEDKSGLFFRGIAEGYFQSSIENFAYLQFHKDENDGGLVATKLCCCRRDFPTEIFAVFVVVFSFNSWTSIKL